MLWLHCFVGCSPEGIYTSHGFLLLSACLTKIKMKPAQGNILTHTFWRKDSEGFSLVICGVLCWRAAAEKNESCEWNNNHRRENRNEQQGGTEKNNKMLNVCGGWLFFAFSTYHTVWKIPYRACWSKQTSLSLYIMHLHLFSYLKHGFAAKLHIYPKNHIGSWEMPGLTAALHFWHCADQVKIW